MTRWSGAAVTFTSGSPGVEFASCSCSTETVSTGAKGKFTSGVATAPASPGPVVITAATGDTVTPTVAYHVTVG